MFDTAIADHAVAPNNSGYGYDVFVILRLSLIL
jgi:hypothetical protein